MRIDEYIRATRAQLSGIAEQDMEQLNTLFSVVSDRVLNKEVVLYLCATTSMKSCLVSLERDYLVYDTTSLFLMKELYANILSKNWFALEFYYLFVREMSSFHQSDILNNYRYAERLKLEPIYVSNTYMDMMKTDTFGLQMRYMTMFIFFHEMAHHYMNDGDGIEGNVIESLVNMAIKNVYAVNGKFKVSKKLTQEMYCDCNALLCLLEHGDTLSHDHIINACLSAVVLSWALNQANEQFYNEKMVPKSAVQAFLRVNVMGFVLDTISSNEELSEQIASYSLNHNKPLKEYDKAYLKDLCFFVHKWYALFMADFLNGPLFSGDEMEDAFAHWEYQTQNRRTMEINIFEEP